MAISVNVPTDLTSEIGLRRRRRIVTVALPAFLGLLAVLASSLFGRFFFQILGLQFGSELFAFLGIALLAIAGATTVMWYLQTGFQLEAEADFAVRRARIDSERSQTELKAALAVSNERRGWIEAEITRLQGYVAELAARVDERPVVDTTPIVAELLTKARSTASEDFLNEVRAHLEPDLRNERIHGRVAEAFYRNSERLNAEVAALSRRGNLNLVLGGVTTVVGLALLSFFVLYEKSYPASPLAFGLHFVPRVTLIVFIQVFAYFFLKLYKSSLSEIKYFQNELTNVEQRQIALISAAQLHDEDTLSKVVDALAKTERNPPGTDTNANVAERDRNLVQTIGEALRNVSGALPGKA